MQQSVDEVETVKEEGDYEIRYFDNPESARLWLQ